MSEDVQKKYERLKRAIRATAPYVIATFAPGNITPSETRPDWVEVHRGRASSSRRQLEALLKLVNEEE